MEEAIEDRCGDRGVLARADGVRRRGGRSSEGAADPTRVGEDADEHVGLAPPGGLRQLEPVELQLVGDLGGDGLPPPGRTRGAAAGRAF